MKKNNKKIINLLLLLAVVCPIFSDTPLDWIKNHMIQPEGINGKLVISYGDDITGVNPGYTGNKRFNPYDQAVVVMALTKKSEIAKENGNFAEAETLLNDTRNVLDGLRAIQNPDGSFYFNYIFDDNKVINETTGPNTTAMVSWPVMAVNYYTWMTGDTSYLDLAIICMDYVKEQQNEDGSVRFTPGNEVVRSVEHALDAYSAWSHLAYLLNKHNLEVNKAEEYKICAGKVRNYIESLWDDNEGRFRRGGSGTSDSYKILDTNTWGILAFGTQSHDGSKDFKRGLEYIENNFKYTQTALNGNIVTGFDANLDYNIFADADRGGDGLDMVWSEGTLGAALAFYEAKDKVKDKSKYDYYLKQYNYYLKEVEKMIRNDGGVLYVTQRGSSAECKNDTEGEFLSPASQAVCVGWYILAKEKVNPFNPFDVTLLGHWDMQPDNDRLKDLSGNDSEGISRNTTPVPGKDGNALEFEKDYNSEVAIVPAGKLKEVGIKGMPYSISFWFKTGSKNYQYLMTKDYNYRQKYNYPFRLTIYNGKVEFSIYQRPSFSYPEVLYTGFSHNVFSQDNMNLADNKWHHVVAVRDIKAKKIKLYIDGIFHGENEGIDNGESVATSAGILIGKYSSYINDYSFTGTIDEVKIYNKALTSAEISLAAIAPDNNNSTTDNMITNGSFNIGSNGWQLDNWGTGQATGAVNNQQYIINITNPGTANHHVQLKYEDLNIEEGKTYTLTFDAYSTSGDRLLGRINIEDSIPTKSYYINNNVNLTTVKQTFSFTFKPVKLTGNDPYARITINCGGNESGTIILDNISLVLEK